MQKRLSKYFQNIADFDRGQADTDIEGNVYIGIMQKECHLPEGEGGLKNFHFAMTNEPFVTPFSVSIKERACSLFSVFAHNIPKNELQFIIYIFCCFCLHRFSL